MGTCIWSEKTTSIVNVVCHAEQIDAWADIVVRNLSNRLERWASYGHSQKTKLHKHYNVNQKNEHQAAQEFQTMVRKTKKKRGVKK